MLQHLRRTRAAGRRRQRDQACHQSLSWLVERAGHGDEEAFGSLTDVLLPWVWTTVAGRVNPDRLAQVSAAAMVLMWQRSPRFDASRERVMQWAYSCTADAVAADAEVCGTSALAT